MQKTDLSVFTPFTEGDIEAKRNEMPSENTLFDLADFFKMFADSSRIRVLFSLLRESLCTSDIARVLLMSESAVCHHLRALKQCNLVSSRRQGKRVIYSLSDSHVADILELGLAHIEE